MIRRKYDVGEARQNCSINSSIRLEKEISLYLRGLIILSYLLEACEYPRMYLCVGVCNLWISFITWEMTIHFTIKEWTSFFFSFSSFCVRRGGRGCTLHHARLSTEEFHSQLAIGAWCWFRKIFSSSAELATRRKPRLSLFFLLLLLVGFLDITLYRSVL